MDYALILNGEVLKILPDYKVQEGDLLEPHPVKQVPYLVPMEKAEEKAFDSSTQMKEGFSHRIENGVVISEEVVRDKTEEEVQAMRDRKLKAMESFILKEYAQNTTQYKEFKAYLDTLTAAEIADVKPS